MVCVIPVMAAEQHTHGFRMDKVAMAAFAAAINESTVTVGLRS